MGLLGVVPQEVFHQGTVEGSRVVQLVEMPVGELLLQGPVEALEMAIGLGMPGIGEEMYQMVRLTTLSEVLLELTAIISLDVGDCKGGYLKEFVQEIPAMG